MIKNIVFDMGNVLLRYDPAAYLAPLVPPQEAQVVAAELFHGPEWQMIDAGGMTEEEAVERVCARIPQYADTVRSAMAGWDTQLTPIEGVEQIVDHLKARGHRLYVLSNASLRFFKYQGNYPIFTKFDGIMISAKEKMVKPDPEIFDHFLAEFRLEARECLFIDDMTANVNAAQTAGMSSARFVGAAPLEMNLRRQGVL